MDLVEGRPDPSLVDVISAEARRLTREERSNPLIDDRSAFIAGDGRMLSVVLLEGLGAETRPVEASFTADGVLTISFEYVTAPVGDVRLAAGALRVFDFVLSREVDGTNLRIRLDRPSTSNELISVSPVGDGTSSYRRMSPALTVSAPAVRSSRDRGLQ